MSGTYVKLHALGAIPCAKLKLHKLPLPENHSFQLLFSFYFLKRINITRHSVLTYTKIQDSPVSLRAMSHEKAAASSTLTMTNTQSDTPIEQTIKSLVLDIVYYV